MVLYRSSVLLVIVLCGCSTGSTAGSEAEARKHLDAEFRKWMGGHESQVETLESSLENRMDPISYDVRSVVPDKPDLLAAIGENNPGGSDDYSLWPAWRFNVAIEWKSRAGTPIEKVTTYRLTWNPRSKAWHVVERF